MNRPSHPRTPARLSDSTTQHVNMYAIAATAAGVELLSLVQPAQAKIIYTPVHKVIKDGQPYSLDLNHDRITDFTITYSDGTGTVQRYFVQEKAAPGNSVVSYPATIVRFAPSFAKASSLTA